MITLTSDWNKSDFYPAAVKGILHQLCPGITIVDICHSITPFNIAEAAFIVKNAYKYFPENSIHLLFVASTLESKQYLAVEAENQFFFTADNGILGLLFDEDTEIKTYKIDNSPVNETIGTFPEMSVLVPAAAKLYTKKNISLLGTLTTTINRQIPLMAVIDNASITTQVIHVDSYGNAICNLNYQLFEKIRKNRNFKITVKNKYNQVKKIHHCYTDVAPGDIFAVFNSCGLLEIGINQANAAELLNISTDTYIRILFFD